LKEHVIWNPFFERMDLVIILGEDEDEED